MEKDVKQLAKELAAQVPSDLEYFVFISHKERKHIEADITVKNFVDFVKTACKCFNPTAKKMVCKDLKTYFNRFKI